MKTSPKTPPRSDDSLVAPLNDRPQHVCVVTLCRVDVLYIDSMQTRSPGLPTPPPLTTNIKPARFSLDSATPRAQTLQDVQGFMSEAARLRSSSASSLERESLFTVPLLVMKTS